MKHLKAAIATSAAALCIGAAFVSAGCGTSIEEQQAQTADPQTESQYLPRVYVDDDGDLIQLAAQDDETDVATFIGNFGNPFNTYYLKADQRGCKSCHSDLYELLNNSDYDHPLKFGNGAEWTISQCLDCHTNGNQGYVSDDNIFATMIHGLHTDVAECWNCHDTSTGVVSSDGTIEGEYNMNLWDNVSHNKMRGISDIASDDMDGELSYTQDSITSQDDLCIINEYYYDWDYERMEKQNADAPLDEETLDDWTITVTGEVDRPTTFNLKDLMENAPKETHLMKWSCVLNPIGGNGADQVECTGVPLSWIMEQVGVKDSATAILPSGADGFSDLGGVPLEQLEGGTPMIVYEMNGEPLQWKNGYPCVIALGQDACGPYVKQLSNIEFTSATESIWTLDGYPNVVADPSEWIFPTHGWPTTGFSDVYNNPNAGITNLKEGQVVKTGESITISGFADAFDKQVAAVEISMDRGKTWKSLDTTDSVIQQLVTWSYTFTPEEDGAYCIAVRAVTADGRVTGCVNGTPVEKMFVARSDVDSLVPESIG